MPILLWVGEVALVVLAVIPSLRNNPGVWPQWHINLAQIFTLFSAARQAVWLMAMLMALGVDAINKRPSVNSSTPTYHRWYYAVKYAAVSGLGAGAMIAVMVAAYGWADRSIVAALGALILMSAIAMLRMRNWQPASMGRQAESAQDPKLAAQLGFGLAYALLGAFGFVSALLGGGSVYDRFVHGLMFFVFAVIGLYACAGFAAWFVFFLIHLGFIRR